MDATPAEDESMARPTRSWIAGVALLALFGGCSSVSKPNNENLTKAINDYYDSHPDCLFQQGRHFPYEVAPGPDAKKDKKQMDALTDAGLMTRLEDRSIHVDRYTLNAAGNRFGPRFCYGHRTVTSIDSFTPPAPHNGFNETTVKYHYTMVEVPVWAKTDQVKAAFPKMANDLSGTASDQMNLATVGRGWQVPE